VRAVFVGQHGQPPGRIVAVGKAVAQRVGAFERQSVHRQAVGVVFRFVGGFGFFFEVVFVKGGLALFVVDVRQRDFPTLLVKQNLDARNRIEAV